jgi:hypothetical protein
LESGVSRSFCMHVSNYPHEFQNGSEGTRCMTHPHCENCLI